ncbi:MAG: hypothetical protein ACR2HR_07640 [Euzebya sp.]
MTDEQVILSGADWIPLEFKASCQLPDRSRVGEQRNVGPDVADRPTDEVR